MIGKTPLLSVRVVAAIAVLLTLSLSVIANPLLFVAKAESGTSAGESLPVSESNTTAAQNPLGDAVLTLDDGTNVLNSEANSDPSPDSSNGAANSDPSPDSSNGAANSDPSPDSSSTDTSSDVGGDAPTGEVGSGTGEVGSGTGEVGSGTGEVTQGTESTEGTPTLVVEPSRDAPPGEASETTDANVTSTDGGAAPADSSAGSSGQSVTSPPLSSTESAVDVASGRREAGAMNTDLSSSPSVDSNGNALSSESVSAASAENPNAVVQPIGMDGGTVSLGDVTNNGGSSAKMSLDKKEGYKPGDTAQVTLEDSEANVDSQEINTVQMVVGKSKNDPSGQVITLTETAIDSGVFVGSFGVTDDKTKNNIFYDTSRPRFNAEISGVSTGGEVEIKELSFSTLPEEPIDVIIGNPVQLTLVGETQLTPGDACAMVFSPPSCGGSTVVTLSYANAPCDPTYTECYINTEKELPQKPSTFTVFQYIPEFGWTDLGTLAYPGEEAIDWNEGAKTVTAVSPFGPGIFAIGVNRGGGGGGGGALGLPGSGLVLDLVAPIVAESPPESPEQSSSTDTESTSTLPDTPVLSVDRDTSDTNTTTSVTLETIKSDEGAGASEQAATSAISRNANTTVAVPGEGNVTISFTNLISDGALTVTTLKDSDLAKFSITKDVSQRGIVKTLDDTPYSLVGSVFMIGPEDTQFNGTITASVPLKASLLPQGSDVRLLHYTGSGWEDVTTQADFNMVSGSFDSLGAVAPAVKSQSISLVSASQ